MRVQDILIGSTLVSILGVLGAGFPTQNVAAQVPNSNSACYLTSPDGVQYDLSALCGDGLPEREEVVLQTGDVQVTLRWDTSDDLDLYVTDPAGDSVFFGNSSVPSGGQLDVDANAGCLARMESPVENIFWPTGQGMPGDYVVTVELFEYCGTSSNGEPVNFTLTTLVQGVTQTQSGSVSAAQSSVSFPFSVSAVGSTEEETAGTVPSSATTALPTTP